HLAAGLMGIHLIVKEASWIPLAGVLTSKALRKAGLYIIHHPTPQSKVAPQNRSTHKEARETTSSLPKIQTAPYCSNSKPFLFKDSTNRLG
ncbi:hypothetical protein U1Q18_017730, partial [Sarracenia purpurea var. burkii]